MRRIFDLLPIRLLWHVVPLLAFCCLPVLKANEWWWQIPQRELLPAIVLIVAYALAAVLVVVFVRRHGLSSAARAVAITLSVFALCLFALALLRIQIPRYLLVPIFLTALILIPTSVIGPRSNRIGLGAALVGLAIVAVATVRAPIASYDSAIEIERTYANTAFYSLQISARKGLIPRPATRGGGLDLIGDRVLLSTGDGHLYVLNLGDPGGDVTVEELPTLVPSNRDEFARAFGGSPRAPKRALDWTERGPPRVQTWRFRVADVIAQPRESGFRLYASHHYWKAADGCFVLRVSTLDLPSSDLKKAAEHAQWRTLFDTTPCVPLTGDLRRRGKNPFKGEEAGGRLVLLDENTLLLSVGDHGFYGLESLQLFAQDPEASYGKTIRIDVNSGHGEIFTTGHRNPQGLFMGADRRLWLSEHGSQGGDELNMLQQGANYGWPFVTYGTEYGATAWPLSAQQGRHEGFVQPQFAWTPSIGVSNLIQIRGTAFPIWSGDLLVGSLAARSLYRVVLDGDRVVLSEPIPLGRRVRDLLELPDGRIVVWTDDGAVITVEPASGRDGAALFSAMCMGCHQAVDGISHRIGPDLYGIAGRRIASAPGYDEYSAALRAHPGRWTREHLDQFLRNPQAFAPGTTMAFGGIPGDEERKALIDYLERLRPRFEWW